jgi:hypothetical protein
MTGDFLSLDVLENQIGGDHAFHHGDGREAIPDFAGAAPLDNHDDAIALATMDLHVPHARKLRPHGLQLPRQCRNDGA